MKKLRILLLSLFALDLNSETAVHDRRRLFSWYSLSFDWSNIRKKTFEIEDFILLHVPFIKLLLSQSRAKLYAFDVH
jgi:hypothetical protein